MINRYLNINVNIKTNLFLKKKQKQKKKKKKKKNRHSPCLLLCFSVYCWYLFVENAAWTLICYKNSAQLKKCKIFFIE